MGIGKSSALSEKLIIISFLYAIWTYIAVRTPFRYYNSWLEIALWGSVVLLAIVLFVINIVSVITERNLFPFMIFLACALVPWFMPETTPQDVYFARYQKDYEKVVELAREHKLEHGGYCQENQYLPPQGYEHIIQDKCISVKYEPVLEIVFLTTKTRGKFLFYAEALYPDRFCSGNLGFVEKKIRNHWYVCDEYWN
jgi:hypothetical protein